MKKPPGGLPIQGNKQAKVAIIEYTDFQCPFCSRNFRQTYPKLVDKYVKTGKASYVAKDFPLSFHSNAKGAAIAARCAGKKGKYWEKKRKGSGFLYNIQNFLINERKRVG